MFQQFDSHPNCSGSICIAADLQCNPCSHQPWSCNVRACHFAQLAYITVTVISFRLSAGPVQYLVISSCMIHSGSSDCHCSMIHSNSLDAAELDSLLAVWHADN